MELKITIREDDIGERLDYVVAHHVKDYSRSQVRRWIEEEYVTVKGQNKKSSYKVKRGDEIFVLSPPPQELSAKPQDIRLDILYEDQDIVIINKSADMVVHPAAGHPDRTLVNALLHHCRDLSGIGGVLRPGIVHRLDKGTSGVIIAAKNDFSHIALSRQFKGRETRKDYKALVYGVPERGKGVFDKPLGRDPIHRKKISTRTKRGKEAITVWEVEESFAHKISLMRVQLVTGRTHQIRAHFSAAGMPLVGDIAYGGRRGANKLLDPRWVAVALEAKRPMLHAASLTFRHPRSGEVITGTAAIPSDFKKILEEFRALSS